MHKAELRPNSHSAEVRSVRNSANRLGGPDATAANGGISNGAAALEKSQMC